MALKRAVVAVLSVPRRAVCRPPTFQTRWRCDPLQARLSDTPATEENACREASMQAPTRLDAVASEANVQPIHGLDATVAMLPLSITFPTDPQSRENRLASLFKLAGNSRLHLGSAAATAPFSKHTLLPRGVAANNPQRANAQSREQRLSALLPHPVRDGGFHLRHPQKSLLTFPAVPLKPLQLAPHSPATGGTGPWQARTVAES